MSETTEHLIQYGWRCGLHGFWSHPHDSGWHNLESAMERQRLREASEKADAGDNPDPVRMAFEDFLGELKASEPDQDGDFTRSYRDSLWVAFQAGWRWARK